MEDLRFMNTTITVKIIFYKGKGTLADKLIRLWTASPYSHSEFGRSDGLFHSNDRFRFISRTQTIPLDPLEWSICLITLPTEIVKRVENRQLKKNGTQYDWMGIAFSQLFRFGFHNKHKWFCSKSNADDLLYAYKLMKKSHNPAFNPFLEALNPLSPLKPQNLSPSDLYYVLQKIETYQNTHLLSS